MITRQNIYILSIITRKMSKLKTHSPTFCVMDKWQNVLNLTHSTKYTWQAFYKFNDWLILIDLICTHHKLRNNNENKIPVSQYIYIYIYIYMLYATEYDVTNTSGTQPRKNIITIGKGDTSDLIMIITWVPNWTGPGEHINPIYCNDNKR